ncbi:hypothetical protein KFK14_19685 [Sphingobium phenoxybenzoativorans]|uniref:Uncharacterized protein n=1 Tax=Sphingobium phenoxybenzoativorans TaxID=1592790 RepID=A0A975K6D9_9SPHN|nr:hypothetical protein [Sphingobium phenoxybenzoativorans]QUT05194.1 hypothetical protein KFK14_19685 [Sphingobium phenoxybenzoativorans]
MSEDVGLIEAAIAAMVAAAIFPIAWIRRKLKQLGEALDFEDKSHN